MLGIRVCARDIAMNNGRRLRATCGDACPRAVGRVGRNEERRPAQVVEARLQWKLAQAVVLVVLVQPPVLPPQRVYSLFVVPLS